MSLKLSITTVLILAQGKFQEIVHFRLADPVPPLDPGCHFDMLCECEKHNDERACWVPGGTHLELNYKIVN